MRWFVNGFMRKGQAAVNSKRKSEKERKHKFLNLRRSINYNHPKTMKDKEDLLLVQCVFLLSFLEVCRFLQ